MQWCSDGCVRQLGFTMLSMHDSKRSNKSTSLSCMTKAVFPIRVWYFLSFSRWISIASSHKLSTRPCLWSCLMHFIAKSISSLGHSTDGWGPCKTILVSEDIKSWAGLLACTCENITDSWWSLCLRWSMLNWMKRKGMMNATLSGGCWLWICRRFRWPGNGTPDYVLGLDKFTRARPLIRYRSKGQIS